MARPASAARLAAHARWIEEHRIREERRAYVAAVLTAPVQGCEMPPAVPEGCTDVLAYLLANVGV